MSSTGKGKPGRLSSVSSSSSPAKFEKVYKLNDLVFAKIRGYPAWPARIEEVKEHPNQPRRYFVFFYGTHQTGTCKSEELQIFHEICEAIKGSTKRKGLLEAIQEAEEYPDVPYVPEIAAPKKLAKKKSGVQETKDDFEKDDVENDEESQEEEGDVKKTPQRKSKTPKAVVQKRPAKSMKQENFDDEEQTSDDNAPVPPKKMKIRKPSFLPKLPALKKSLVKKEALTDDESEESKLELPAPKIAEVEEPVEVDFMDHMFIQFREPEDENMPEDERIVRKLIKSAVWECINDNSALDTIVRRMRQYFSDDKIKNWDQDELLESIDYERTRSKEKIQECLILKDWDVTNLDNQLLEEDIKAKMKAVSEESDEDEEMDDDKGDGVFMKYYTQHQLELMRQMQFLKCSPPYYTYIVHLANKSKDNEFSYDSEPLTALEQRDLYREEEKFVLLANELPATLPKTEQADTKSAIELLKHLTAVNVTKTMLYKNISCVLNIYNLSKYNTNSGVSADLSKASQAARKEENEKIKQLAVQLIKKFKELVLPDDWLLDNSPTPSQKDEEQQLNGDDSLQSTSGRMSNDKSSWMLYDILKAKHSVLLKAAEGNKDEFTKILQEPVALNMSKTEYSQLKTLLYSHNCGQSNDNKAALKISALARSINLGADSKTKELPAILLKNGKSEAQKN